MREDLVNPGACKEETSSVGSQVREHSDLHSYLYDMTVGIDGRMLHSGIFKETKKNKKQNLRRNSRFTDLFFFNANKNLKTRKEKKGFAKIENLLCHHH